MRLSGLTWALVKACRAQNQWWNRRIPVKAIAIPYLSQHSMTASSLTDPPGSAIYFTPLFFARSILSENGKNASDPRAISFA